MAKPEAEISEMGLLTEPRSARPPQHVEPTWSRELCGFGAWRMEGSFADPVELGQAATGGGAGEQLPLRVMAPPPSGLTLYLSAFGSLGAWQLLRNVRKLHLQLPSWYHAGAPAQIGHAVAFDFDFQFQLESAPPAASSVGAPSDGPPVFIIPRRATRWRPLAQYSLPLGAPRAPPCA